MGFNVQKKLFTKLFFSATISLILKEVCMGFQGCWCSFLNKQCLKKLKVYFNRVILTSCCLISLRKELQHVLARFKIFKTTSLLLSEKSLKCLYLSLVAILSQASGTKSNHFSINFKAFLTNKPFFGNTAGHLPRRAKVKYAKVIFYFRRIYVSNIYLVEVTGKVVNKEDGEDMKITHA